MIRRSFGEDMLPLLGFGTMRLPLKEDKSIDEAAVDGMVDYALSHGVRYFDTAWPYHGGTSEVVIGRSLARYPREQWLLASKYPGHQIASSYDPAGLFEKQLKKCGVDYFDFYLLHNVCENSWNVYHDARWGIIDYFLEQRRKGRIRHLGFSTHARPETLRAFLEEYGAEMEFCQIQLNYLDWTLQDARQKVDLLNEHRIPIWVMEPVRGGKLARLSPEAESSLRAARPDESIPAWAFRWLQSVPGVTMVLSGMSSLSQMEDNVRTFSSEGPLSGSETALLLGIAESLKDSVPCTACRYCVDGCPAGLNIPMLLAAYNDARYDGNMNVSMMMDALPPDKLPSACLSCGACASVCPQKIDVPAALADFTARLKTMPNWTQICREREEAARKLEGK